MLRMRAGGPIVLEAAATVTRWRRVGYTISPPQEFVFEAGLQMATHLERGGDRKGGRGGGGRKVEMAHTHARTRNTHAHTGGPLGS